MINSSEIKKKATKLYSNVLTSLINQEIFFPLFFPVGKIPQDFLGLKNSLADLLKNSQEEIGYGYKVIWKITKMKKFGEQSLPEQILIETESDYLKLLGKEKEVKQFKLDIELILSELPQLKDWLIYHPLEVVKYAREWSNLVKVCHYFIDHPQPNLYLRELPIKVHTKFIETHKSILTSLLEFILPPELINSTETTFEKRFSLKYDETLIRVRILDEKIKLKYQLPFTDFSIPFSQFKALNWLDHRWIITENKMNFLTLPPLENTMALFGSGNQVPILKSIDWLSQATIFYWGDLDIHGFMILDRLRSYFPHVISVMMDQETLTTFADFIGVDPNESSLEKLTNLSEAENLILSDLSRCKKRLEQEQISQLYVNQYLFNLFSIINLY
jgi:hypothetical protein